MPKSKTPGRYIQLEAAETQIKQNAVNFRKAMLTGDAIDLIERRLDHT